MLLMTLSRSSAQKNFPLRYPNSCGLSCVYIYPGFALILLSVSTKIESCNVSCLHIGKPTCITGCNNESSLYNCFTRSTTLFLLFKFFVQAISSSNVKRYFILVLSFTVLSLIPSFTAISRFYQTIVWRS